MSTEARAAESHRPNLHCCQGAQAPEDLFLGWSEFLAMRTSARQEFLELLTASILEPDAAAAEAGLARFCDGHGIEERAAFGALRACQFLLQRSAALDLGAELFIDDLQNLSSEDSGGARLVASRYLPLKQRIREHLLDETLADHGKVLVGLDWRIDQVASADRAVNLNTPVVFLTLRLRDGEAVDRVTVQLTNRSIQMLRQFCHRFSDSTPSEQGG